MFRYHYDMTPCIKTAAEWQIRHSRFLITELSASHQTESGGNVHDIMTHTGFSMIGFYEHSHASVR